MTTKGFLDHQALSDEELREILKAFATLIKHPGWVKLLAYATDANQMKNGRVLTSCLNMEDTLEHEGLKGEIRGAHFVLELPTRVVEEIRELLELTTSEEDEGSLRYQEPPELNPNREENEDAT